MKHPRRAMIVAVGAGLTTLGLVGIRPTATDVLGQTAPTPGLTPAQRERLAAIREALARARRGLTSRRALRGLNRRQQRQLRSLLRRITAVLRRLLAGGTVTAAALRRLASMLSRLARLARRNPALRRRLRSLAASLRRVARSLRGSAGAPPVAARLGAVDTWGLTREDRKVLTQPADDLGETLAELDLELAELVQLIGADPAAPAALVEEEDDETLAGVISEIDRGIVTIEELDDELGRLAVGSDPATSLEESTPEDDELLDALDDFISDTALTEALLRRAATYLNVLADEDRRLAQEERELEGEITELTAEFVRISGTQP